MEIKYIHPFNISADSTTDGEYSKPGTNPASKTPSRKRQATKPPKHRVTPWQTVMIPSQRTTLAFYESRGSDSNYTPRQHNGTKPRGRCNILQNEVARDLAEYVRDEEDKQSDVVIVTGHA